MPGNRPLPANVRAPKFYVAYTESRCWHCDLSTHLLALAMPNSHETLDAEAQSGAEEGGESASVLWQRANVHALLFYVQQLPEDVQHRLNQLFPSFRLAYSSAALNSYWANHCEHCGELLGDHELHCEPDGAFMPSSEAAAANIRLLLIEAPFEAVAAAFAFDPEFFGFMRKD